MDKRIARIWEFYKRVNPLKCKTRTGWKDWGITPENDIPVRGESMAEHSNSAAWLAFAIKSEFPDEYKNIDIERVVTALNFHELDEATIPDFTPFSGITREQKRALGNAAVAESASILSNGGELVKYINEFEDAKTANGKFASMCDKLDAGLQCKIYEEAGLIPYNREPRTIERKHRITERGHKCLADSWLAHCVENYDFDPTFTKIATELQVTRTEKLGELVGALNAVKNKKSHEIN